MKELNITQGRYGNFSHKNLNAYDLVCNTDGSFYAPTNLLVVGVLPYETTGFANTVFFYDVENDVTLALTHIDNLMSKHRVGTVIERGTVAYAMGSKGKATGKHIHMEIGKGKQTTKTKINGEWRLINLIDIEDYFYINNQFTKTLTNALYNFGSTEPDKDVTHYVLTSIYTGKVGLRLRNGVKGTILKVIEPYKEYTFDYIYPLPYNQADGYQWFVGVKCNIRYYFQFDSKAYWIY